MLFRQTFVLLLISTLLGLGVNLFSPNKIPYIGKYRTISNSEGPIVPPDAEPGDPPFIGIDVAEMEYSHGDVIFVDAREPEEFDCGTIPGSINIPFDYLPEDNLAGYLDSALGGAEKNHMIITYCSGEECDLSLHLARNMQILGYNNTSIFFGGSREWEKFGLGLERRTDCEE